MIKTYITDFSGIILRLDINCEKKQMLQWLKTFKRSNSKNKLLIDLTLSNWTFNHDELRVYVEDFITTIQSLCIKALAFITNGIWDTTFASIVKRKLNSTMVHCNVFHQEQNAINWLQGM